MFPEAKNVKFNAVQISFTKHSRCSAVQRSRVAVMAHVIFFVIQR